MANLACLIKDTQIVEDIKDILRTAATLEIAEGRTFSLPKAYSLMRDAQIEVDLESVGHVYENTFDLTDGNFTAQGDVNAIVGASFKETLDNLVAMEPSVSNQTTGILSPAAQVAKGMATAFRNANVTDIRTHSMILKMQKALDKAARRIVNKSDLPDKAKTGLGFEDVLRTALDLENRGFTTLSNTFNHLGDVWIEFQKEIDAYRKAMKASDASEAEIASFEKYTQTLMDKGYELMLSSREAQDTVKGALIEAGFGREITQKGVVRQILDWKKLANIGGDLGVMRENVSRVLSDKGFNQSEIDRINQTLENEYISLKASVIEKGLTALNQRNKISKGTQKSSAKRLAELYSYGLFDAMPDTYDHLLNNLMGVPDLDQETFSKLKVFAKSLQTLYSTRFNDQTLNEEQLKTGINTIGVQIEKVLHANRNNHSKFLRVATAIQTYMEGAQRMILNTLKNAWFQNPLSGYEAKLNTRVAYNKFSSPEMQVQQTRVANAVRKDIVRNGGVPFGDVNSVFVNRGGFDNLVNSWSDSKLYHKVMSVAIGRFGLDALDSFYKVSLVEKKFAGAMIKVLTDPSNPNKMTKEDALSYVSEKLTGQNFEKAKAEAEKVIAKINSEAGMKVIPDDDYVAVRMANDMVKAALVQGTKVTEDMIMAAYKSSYRAAGRDLGHVPNNWLSKQIQLGSSNIEKNIADAVKKKQYSDAAVWTLASIAFRNFANPFIGGGTNWIFLKAEKMGFGVVSGSIAHFRNRGRKIDMSTEAGMKEVESVLYEQFKETDKRMRGIIGGLASLAITLIASYKMKPCKGSEGAVGKTAKEKAAWVENEDCYGAWRKRNRWISKYLDEITPEWYLAAIAAQGGEMSRYITNFIGKNDDFSSTTQIVDGIEKYSAGDKNEAAGLWGKAVGQKVAVPVPWRLAQGIWTIGQGVAGKQPDQMDFSKSRGFLDGVTRGGILEFLGVNHIGEYELSDLPGNGEVTMRKAKEIGINDINDLKGKNVRTLRGKDGRLLYKKADAEEIKEILKKQGVK